MTHMLLTESVYVNIPSKSGDYVEDLFFVIMKLYHHLCTSPVFISSLLLYSMPNLPYYVRYFAFYDFINFLLKGQ